MLKTRSIVLGLQVSTLWAGSMLSDPVSALEIRLESTALVGGTRGCCYYDDGEVDALTTHLPIASTAASFVGPLSSARSWASVNAYEGTLRGYAEGLTGGVGNAAAQSYAFLTEFITVTKTDLAQVGGTSYVKVSMPSDFEILKGYVAVSVSLVLRNCTNIDCTSGPAQQSGYSGPQRPAGSYNVAPTVFLPYDELNPRYLISASFDLNAGAVYGGSFGNFGEPDDVIDFSGTSYLGVDLDDGYYFTSDSGVFLTPVPEPNIWISMLVGLGVIGQRVYRRMSQDTRMSLS